MAFTPNVQGSRITGSLTGITSVSAVTISATTLYGNGSNLTGIPSFTGGTITGPTTFTAGLTANTISATTYQNLPTDIRVTGGTYSTGTATFTNNTGGTFTLTGLYTGYTAPTDIRVTGGTYTSGTATFTNNTGGTFTVSGFSTGTSSTDTFVTGATYSNNTFTFRNNTGSTFNVLFNTVTGLTVNGDIIVTGNTNISGTTTVGGDVNTLGYLRSYNSTGDEGGEIFLNKAATNTTLIGGVTIDVWQNRLRFFEQGGTARGVYIDLTAAGAGVSTNLLSGGGGEINTASNLGSGTGLFAQKVAADLQFKSLTSTGGTVTLTNNATTVNLEVVPASNFTGGTVNGATNFTNGLTANTISATTYFNLPNDIRVTGGTYSNNTFTYTNNTGGTFSTLFNTMTGLTITGNLTVTGGTQSWFSGNSSSDLVRITQTGTGNAFVVEDSASTDTTSFTISNAGDVGIGTAPEVQYKLEVKGTGQIAAIYGIGGTAGVQGTGTQYGVYGVQDGNNVTGVFGHNLYGAGTNAFGVRGQAINGVGVSGIGGVYGGIFLADSQNGSPIGVYATVSGGENGGTGAYIAGKFDASGGEQNYAVQLIDGTQGVNKVLVSQTSDGKANWSSSLSGLTGVYTNTISATTYFNLPTDVRVTGGTYSSGTATFTNNTGGTFTVTGFSTGTTLGTYLTGASYSNNVLTFTTNSGTTSTVTINTVTGLTSTGTIASNVLSATTYQNLPIDVRVTGGTLSSGTATFTNNTGGTFTVTGFSTGGGTFNGGTVTGATYFTGGVSANTLTASGTGQNILTVIGSGNSTTSPIFSVVGSQGELFSVTDSLTGSLFSVNDISGLPIVEAFSDNTILMGSYQAPSLNTTVRLTLTAGTNTVYSIPTSGYTGAFFDYTVISTGSTGARAGTIMSIWSGTTAQSTDVSTNDIGTTAGISFSVAVVGSNAVLSSSATTTGWTLKTIVRSI